MNIDDMLQDDFLQAIRVDLRRLASISMEDYVEELQEILTKRVRRFSCKKLTSVVDAAIRQDPEKRLAVVMADKDAIIVVDWDKGYIPEDTIQKTKLPTKKAEIIKYYSPPRVVEPPKPSPIEKAKAKRTPQNFKNIPTTIGHWSTVKEFQNMERAASLPEPFDVIRQGNFNTTLTNSPDGRSHHPNATAKLNEIMGTFNHSVFH